MHENTNSIKISTIYRLQKSRSLLLLILLYFDLLEAGEGGAKEGTSLS